MNKDQAIEKMIQRKVKGGCNEVLARRELNSLIADAGKYRASGEVSLALDLEHNGFAASAKGAAKMASIVLPTA